jgi:hypothetical protein
VRPDRINAARLLIGAQAMTVKPLKRSALSACAIMTAAVLATGCGDDSGSGITARVLVTLEEPAQPLSKIILVLTYPSAARLSDPSYVPACHAMPSIVSGVFDEHRHGESGRAGPIQVDDNDPKVARSYASAGPRTRTTTTAPRWRRHRPMPLGRMATATVLDIRVSST